MKIQNTFYNSYNKMAKIIMKGSKITGRIEVKVSQNIWSNLKKVEIYLVTDTMRYKILDIKSLLERGFTEQNGPDIIPIYYIN